MRRAIAAPLLSAASVLIVFAGTGCQPTADTATAKAAADTATAKATATAAAAAPHVAAPKQPHIAPAAKHAAARRRSPQRGDVVINAGRVILPSSRRTPGATSAAVTPQTIRSTICRTGYTKTVRPSSSYTTALKVQQLRSGYAFRGDLSTRDYEEDHLIALELGGSPSSPRNLWPEPYATAAGAGTKDLVENQLHDLVCAGRVSLRTAQRAIATNWWQAYRTYGGRAVPVVFNGLYSGSRSTIPGGPMVPATSGPTARCVDGTLSYSQHRSGTCSHHGGVAQWINPPRS